MTSPIQNCAAKGRGFTLVETIVTMVIVAVLSTAAVFTYNGFMAAGRRDAAEVLAQTAASAANSYLMRSGEHPGVENLRLRYDSTQYEIIIETADSSLTVTNRNHSEISVRVEYK